MVEAAAARLHLPALRLREGQRVRGWHVVYDLAPAGRHGYSK
jgi:hypothetical protein